MKIATKHNRYLYNKSLRPLAGALRKNMTKAEACLWKYVLRAGLPAEGTQAGAGMKDTKRRFTAVRVANAPSDTRLEVHRDGG